MKGVVYDLVLRGGRLGDTLELAERAESTADVA